MRPQLYVADNQGGISQDVAMPELVQVQQHVVGVAGELLHVSLSRGSGLHLLRPVDPVSFQYIHDALSDLQVEQDVEGIE